MRLKLLLIHTTKRAQSALAWILHLVHVHHVLPLLRLVAECKQTQLALEMGRSDHVHIGFMHLEPLRGVAYEIALIAHGGTAVVLVHVPLQLLGSDEQQFADLAPDGVLEVAVGFVHVRVDEAALALDADEGDRRVEFDGVELEQVGLGEHARAAGAVKRHLVFVAGSHVAC